MQKLFIRIGTIAVALLFTGCAGTQVISYRTVVPIAIDGQATDWQKHTDLRIAELSAGITAKHDADNLYLLLTFSDKHSIRSLVRQGFTLWLDPAGEKNKDHGVHFSPIRDRSAGAEVPGRMPPRVRGGEPDTLPIRCYTTVIHYSESSDGSEAVVPPIITFGKTDSADICEIAIPLGSLSTANSSETSPAIQQLSLGFSPDDRPESDAKGPGNRGGPPGKGGGRERGGDGMPPGGGPGGGGGQGRGMPRGDNGPPGVEGRRPNQLEEFWVKVILSPNETEN